METERKIVSRYSLKEDRTCLYFALTNISVLLNTTICDLVRSSSWIVLSATVEKILKSWSELSLLQARNLDIFSCCLQDIVVLCCSIIAGQKEKTIYRQKDRDKVEKAK